MLLAGGMLYSAAVKGKLNMWYSPRDVAQTLLDVYLQQELRE